MRSLPLVLAAALCALSASAQPGPGLGNQAWSADEVFEPVGFIDSPGGHGNVTLVQGYLMVIYSSDGGGHADDGGFEFWDVSDPSSPALVASYEDADTHGLREAHGFSLAWIGERLVLAAQGIDGVQLWDVTDPVTDVTLLAYLDLPGVDRGDYSGDWWLFWQAPTLYVAGVDSGLYIVDATDPVSPALVEHVATGALAGVSPAQVFAIGNLLLVVESQGLAFATLDISDPHSPRVLRRVDGKAGYSHVFGGDGKILTSGNIPPRAHVHQLDADGGITHVSTFGLYFDSGGYGTYQDGFFHSGFSDNYVKFDIDGESEVGKGTSGRDGRDEDFATVLGNLAFAGDDHGKGSALIPHQTEPDTAAPVVEWLHPAAGSVGVALSSRFGLSFSDHVDGASVTSDTVWLEAVATGDLVPAVVSSQLGIVNLAPAEPLARNTEYRVVAEGVLDVAGNPSPRFEGVVETGDGNVGLAPSAVVSNVQNNSALNNDYAVLTFGAGATVYSDRDYVFTPDHPERFAGAAYIQTANNDKLGFSSDFLRFDLAVPAEVVVLYDDRASSRPDWLDAFTDTGETVDTDDADFTVHARSYPAGPVTLGGNNASGADGQDSMYSVVIRAEELACDVDLSPRLAGTVSLTSAGPAGATYDWQIGATQIADGGADVSTELAPGRHSVVVTVSDAPRVATCSGVLVVHRPLVDEPARTSGRMVWSGNRTVNVNPDNGTVAIVDADTQERVAEVDVGPHPEALALAPNGDVWVVDRDAAEVVVVDLDSRTVAARYPLPRASRPSGIVVGPSGKAWVSLTATGEIARLDDVGNIEATEHVAPTARGLTLFDGALYVSRFLSPDERGELYVVDPGTLLATGVIPLAFDEGPDTEASGRGVPNYLSPMHVSPDGALGFVGGKKDNVARGLYRDGEPLTFESRVRAFVAVIDLATGEELIDRRMDVNDRELTRALAASPLGDLLFVASQGVNTIDVFETATGRRVSQLDTGLAPQAIAFDAAGERLAVYAHLSRVVDLLDPADVLSGSGNNVQLLASVATVESEALSAVVLEGKRVFHNAADPRMSRDSYLSCASCHLDGGHDGRVWDFTQAGEGLRNTIDLRGRAGTGHGNVHWTANFDELQDFENDIRGAFGGTGFLSDEDFEATRDPLGSPKAGRSAELDALAAYVATFVEVPASPWRREDGSLSAAARRGRAVFVAAECQACHAGASFSDLERHDVGTIGEGSGQGIGAALAGTGFDTPTLLGVWSSAPYLHDGSAPTLADAVTRHAGVDLDREALDDLVAYLRELDGASAAPEADCATADECVELAAPDAGPGDGPGPPDAGCVGDDCDGDETPASCACRSASADASALLWLALAAVTLRRRRRR